MPGSDDLGMLDHDELQGVAVFSRNHKRRDSLLAGRVGRIRSIVLLKTRAILWLWFLIPCAVAYVLPSMQIAMSVKGMVAYSAWVLFGMMFHHVVINPYLRRTYYPASEDHAEGFPVGYQPDFWQWKLFEESRDDLKEISGRLEILPAPTMAMKSIPSSGFGMVDGTEYPNESACVIFPVVPTDIQWGFSRRAHRGILIHECGHIVLSTRLWSQRFEMLHFVLAIPLTILFTILIGQIAAYQGVSQQEWNAMAKCFYMLQVPYIMAVMFGKLGERILSRIHEFGCDAITAVYGEGEGLTEAFYGFRKFTRQLVAKKPWGRRIAWYLLTLPYREVWGTHPNLARRINNCRSYMH